MSSMDLNKLNVLKQKNELELQMCAQKLDQWMKFRNDYKALRERLTTITDTTTQDIMVPIGGNDTAFMSAYLHHTNEILVLLGDNYFVERSAKQALEIVDRRIGKCDQTIADVKREKTLVESWLAFTNTISDEKTDNEFVEIIEEFDEQKEKEWREKHKLSISEYKRKSAEERLQNPMNIEEKLKQLEIEEELQEVEVKSILKKSDKRKESVEKCVSFDDKSIPIINEKEEYPESKYTQQSKQVSDESYSDVNTINEVPFKNEIIEKNVSQTNVIESHSSKPMSRFKAGRLKK